MFNKKKKEEAAAKKRQEAKDKIANKVKAEEEKLEKERKLSVPAVETELV